MASKTVRMLGFFLLIATTSLAHPSDVKAGHQRPATATANQLEEMNQNLREENANLRKLVDLLQQRDVESDIVEIREILKTYGEDITTLRINQVLD